MKFQNPSMHGCKIWHAGDFILIFSKGHNSRKGDNSDKKKKCLSTIFPSNFKTLACTVFDKRTNTWTDARMHNPKPICSCNFFEVEGIMTQDEVSDKVKCLFSCFTSISGDEEECWFPSLDFIFPASVDIFSTLLRLVQWVTILLDCDKLQ